MMKGGGGSSSNVAQQDLNAKLDEEFIKVMYDIEKNYADLTKHEKIRVEQWTKKLCQITTNVTWKQNRNLYARLLHHMVLQKRLDEPFAKMPPEGPLPTLNKAVVVI
jgi:hypothetical protein